MTLSSICKQSRFYSASCRIAPMRHAPQARHPSTFPCWRDDSFFPCWRDDSFTSPGARFPCTGQAESSAPIRSVNNCREIVAAESKVQQLAVAVGAQLTNQLETALPFAAAGFVLLREIFHPNIIRKPAALSVFGGGRSAALLHCNIYLAPECCNAQKGEQGRGANTAGDGKEGWPTHLRTSPRTGRWR